MVDQEADGKDGETLKANDRGDTASDGDWAMGHLRQSCKWPAAAKEMELLRRFAVTEGMTFWHRQSRTR